MHPERVERGADRRPLVLVCQLDDASLQHGVAVEPEACRRRGRCPQFTLTSRVHGGACVVLPVPCCPACLPLNDQPYLVCRHVISLVAARTCGVDPVRLGVERGERVGRRQRLSRDAGHHAVWCSAAGGSRDFQLNQKCATHPTPASNIVHCDVCVKLRGASCMVCVCVDGRARF